MKKIRIGNDIRLAVDLRKQVLEGDDTLAVRKVTAYLVNTTKVAEYEAKLNERPKFIGRFPIEPFSHCYNTTPWCLCGCGMPTYNAFPINAGHVYSGFGVEPYTKRNKELAAIARRIQYKAACKATQQQNVIYVYFPANHQLATGVYKLVIVAEIYYPGYNVENIKTIQADVPDVFELVSTSEEGIDTGVILSVNVESPVGDDINQGTDPGSEIEPTPEPSYPDIIFDDIYVTEGATSGTNIILNRTDNTPVSINLNDIAGWYDED